jgi:hypothetical protein
MARAFLNIVLKPPSDWLLSLCAGEGCNTSHGWLCEVKEILKNLVTFLLENDEAVVAAVPAANPVYALATRLPLQSIGGRPSATPVSMDEAWARFAQARGARPSIAGGTTLRMLFASVRLVLK